MRNALACGDYQLAGKSDIAVDTKKDIAELIGDIQVKQMAKKDVAAAVRDISVKFNIVPELQSQIYHLIVDDDSERLVEAELVRLCMDSGIPEYAISLFQSLYVKRHGFFHRGLIRAKFYGTKLYVLVENNDGVKDIDSLFKWVNPRTKITVPDYTKPIGRWHNGAVRYARKRKYPNCMQGQTLAKACLTMEKKYGVKFVFCRPEESGEKIMELLRGKQQ